jgi:acyl-CoA thioester hydrolase
MGVAYHANYLIWMEVARTDLCRALGFDYKSMESGTDGVLLAVTEAHCRYLNAARYDEEICIVASLGEVNRRFVSFEYRFSCGARRVAEGVTKHIFLNKGFRPIRLPDQYAPLFGLA